MKIRVELIRQILFVVALAVLPAGGVTLSITVNAAEESAISAAVGAQPSPTPPPEDDVFLVIEKVKEEKKAEKQEGAPPKPPAKDERLVEELEIRAMFLKAQREQAKQAQERAERTTNPAERQVLLKEAQLKSETVQSMTRTIVGPSPEAPANNQPAQGSNPGSSSGTAAAPGGSRLNLKQTWGALEQLKQSNVDSTEAAKSKNEAGAKSRATEAFKEGRAGAGGVALYKAATVLTSLDPAKMTSAQIEGERLVLVYDGRKLLFPKLDPQFLAVAMRSVYGGEGLVKGTLMANEPNAVVLSTGKEQYGDVVWKKEFLPGLPAALKTGEAMALDLGPGVGVLSLPDPSHDRVTYYGPLKGNVLGRVVQEADMVFSMYWYGVDWRTGKPLDPTKLDGYESSIETDLRQTGNPDEKMPRREPSKNWWEDTVWFVWTPDEISLQLSSETNEFQFVKATMKCNVWGVREENVRPSSRLEGAHLTKHYDDYARAFPVLAELKEAAKAVAVVRWLKQNNVPLALGWARSYPLARVETPDKIRRYSVYVHRDRSGKPIIETPE